MICGKASGAAARVESLRKDRRFMGFWILDSGFWNGRRRGRGEKLKTEMLKL
jgi:hypothetical protein